MQAARQLRSNSHSFRRKMRCAGRIVMRATVCGHHVRQRNDEKLADLRSETLIMWDNKESGGSGGPLQPRRRHPTSKRVAFPLTHTRERETPRTLTVTSHDSEGVGKKSFRFCKKSLAAVPARGLRDGNALLYLTKPSKWSRERPLTAPELPQTGPRGGSISGLV